MINDDIRDAEIRLIDADGSMLGIMPSKAAQDLAASKNLDLVKIAPQAKPPVCKIMDYGKHMFEQSKKEKEARKNQKVISVKEIWLKPAIEEHDFNFKIKNAAKFLKEGDKVKISVRFRGREMNYTSSGIIMLNKVADIVSDVGLVERKPKLEGRSMTMILNPLNKPQAPAGGKPAAGARPAAAGGGQQTAGAKPAVAAGGRPAMPANPAAGGQQAAGAKPAAAGVQQAAAGGSSAAGGAGQQARP
jgi:translation initiation factor IF-3